MYGDEAGESILNPRSLHVMFFLRAELAKEARKEVLSH